MKRLKETFELIENTNKRATFANFSEKVDLNQLDFTSICTLDIIADLHEYFSQKIIKLEQLYLPSHLKTEFSKYSKTHCFCTITFREPKEELVKEQIKKSIATVEQTPSIENLEQLFGFLHYPSQTKLDLRNIKFEDCNKETRERFLSLVKENTILTTLILPCLEGNKFSEFRDKLEQITKEKFEKNKFSIDFLPNLQSPRTNNTSEAVAKLIITTEQDPSIKNLEDLFTLLKEHSFQTTLDFHNMNFEQCTQEIQEKFLELIEKNTTLTILKLPFIDKHKFSDFLEKLNTILQKKFAKNDFFIMMSPLKGSKMELLPVPKITKYEDTNKKKYFKTKKK